MNQSLDEAVTLALMMLIIASGVPLVKPTINLYVYLGATGVFQGLCGLRLYARRSHLEAELGNLTGQGGRRYALLLLLIGASLGTQLVFCLRAAMNFLQGG